MRWTFDLYGDHSRAFYKVFASQCLVHSACQEAAWAFPVRFFHVGTLPEGFFRGQMTKSKLGSEVVEVVWGHLIYGKHGKLKITIINRCNLSRIFFFFMKKEKDHSEMLTSSLGKSSQVSATHGWNHGKIRGK